LQIATLIWKSGGYFRVGVLTIQQSSGTAIDLIDLISLRVLTFPVELPLWLWVSISFH